MACGPRRGLGTTGQADSPVWRDTVESKKPSAGGSILTEGSLHSRAFGSPSRAVGPRLWSGGCAGSGHASAPPSSVMNSRRLNGIRFPTSQVEWQDIELARISQRVCELRTDTPKVRVDFAERDVMEYWIGLPHQSALMFAARTTLAHFSVSSVMSLLKSPGEPPRIMPPRSVS